MTGAAQGLEVLAIEEQCLIVAVRFDVIDVPRDSDAAVLPAHAARGLCVEHIAAQGLPSGAVVQLRRCSPLRRCELLIQAATTPLTLEGMGYLRDGMTLAVARGVRDALATARGRADAKERHKG